MPGWDTPPSAGQSNSNSNSNTGRDTGSNYGQFDRAVSQAQNNPAPSSGGDGVNWSPSDDIDSTYTTTSFDVTPEESSAGKFMDNITSAYEKVEVPIKAFNVITSADPVSFGLNMLSYTAAKNKQKAAQDAYIASLPTGEDGYGEGDYMEDVQDYSARVYDTDYLGLDQEGQAELDLDYAKNYGLDYFDPNEIVKDGSINLEDINKLPNEQQEIITDLVPYMAHVIGGSELPPSVFDKHFSDIAQSGNRIMESYNTIKDKTNKFLTTPITTASYGIFEDTRLRGLI